MAAVCTGHFTDTFVLTSDIQSLARTEPRRRGVMTISLIVHDYGVVRSDDHGLALCLPALPACDANYAACAALRWELPSNPPL
jgi:hypothetical protein